jgi:hypothetical protein
VGTEFRLDRGEPVIGVFVAVGVAFWGTVLGGGFYFVRRYVRAVERRTSQEENVAALQARLATLEELLDGMRADIQRLEAGQEFTARLLTERAQTSSPTS